MPTDDQAPHERPLSQHAAARLGYALTAVDMSDYTAALVPTSTDQLAAPGEFITQARRARTMATALLVRAVLLERANGQSWKQIAHAFGYDESYVRGQYEPVEREWLSLLNGGSPAEFETIEMTQLLKAVPVTDDEIRETAAELDDWCDRRRDQDAPKGTLRLVSDGLAV